MRPMSPLVHRAFPVAAGLLATALLFSVAAGAAQPQSPVADIRQPYPSKALHLIVGLPAGGGADVLARIIAARLSDLEAQPVLVENRPGSAGLLAADSVAKSAPDGYTMLIGGNGNLAIFASLYKSLPYDPVGDFAPVSLLVTFPNVLVVNPSLPVHSVAEFVAYARANPGKLSYASAGNGSSLHLTMEMLKSMAGIDLVHVPYKGGVQALTDLFAGRVQTMFEILPTDLPLIKAGKLRALAVTGTRRSEQLPSTPTIAEAGFSGFEVTTWHALVAPRGTPAPVISRVNADLAKVLRSSETQARLAEQGADAAYTTPEQLASYQRAEIGKWAKAVIASGATAE